MNLMQAIVLGVVEGITEYLPVSSTGHLILAAAALGLGVQDGSTASAREIHEALQRFSVIIQGGAILAVAGLYWPRVRLMLRGAGSLAVPSLRGSAARDGVHLLTLLVAGFVPAAVVGLLANKWIKANLFFPVPVIGALLAGGVVMILLSRWHRRRLQASGRSHADELKALRWQQAFVIGCFQVLAMWPGTSRSMVTMLGGMFIGLPPVAVAAVAATRRTGPAVGREPRRG